MTLQIICVLVIAIAQPAEIMQNKLETEIKQNTDDVGTDNIIM